MNEIGRRPKNELIAEIEKLRSELSSMERVIKVNSRLSGVMDEEKLFSMFDVPDADELWMITDTGRIIYVNSLASERLGYSLEDIQRLSISQIDPLYPRGKWLHVVNSLKRSQKPQVFETKHVSVDGVVLEKVITAQYALFEGRYYVIGVARVSATKEKQSEIAPPPSEEPAEDMDLSRESIVLNSVTEGVVYVDTSGSIIEINPSAAKLFGYPRQEMLGRNYLDPRWRFFDQNDDPVKISEHPLAVALVAEVPVANKPVSIITSEGGMRSLIVSASPVFDAKKKLSGAVATLHAVDTPQSTIEEPVNRQVEISPVHSMAEIIIRSRSLDELERRTCELFVLNMGFALAWVGAIRPNDARVHQSTSVGPAVDYLLKVKIRMEESEYSKEPISRSIRDQEPQVVSDLSVDVDSEPWKKQAIKQNLMSMAVFPVRFEGHIQRVINVYSNAKQYFTPDVYMNLRRCVDLFAFGAQAILDRDARTINEVKMRETEVLLRTVLDTMPVGICQFDPRPPYRCTWHNAAYQVLLDEPFRSGTITHTTLADFQFSHIQTDLAMHLQSAVETGTIVSDSHAVLKDWEGMETHWHWMVVPVRQDQEITSLLHIAIQHDAPPYPDPARIMLSVNEGQTSYPKMAAMEKIPDLNSVFDLMKEGFLCIEAPVLPARARKEKKLSTLNEEGRIIQCNYVGAELLDSANPSEIIGRSPLEIFADSEFQDLFVEVLSSKDNEASMTRTRASDKGHVQILRYRIFADRQLETVSRFWMNISIMS